MADTRWMTGAIALGSLLILGAGWGHGAEPTDWPQFLGPQRNGISPETGLLNQWPSAGPKVLWQVPGGVGMSGIAVRDGRIATLVQRDEKQWLVCHDAQTGKPVWQTPLSAEYRNAMGDGPRGTPAIAGDRIFAFTGEGSLFAADWKSGKLAWSHSVVKELKAKEAEYGMASSPLIVGDLVIVTAGSPRGTLVAFDQATGQPRWTAGADAAGYSSPTLLTLGGKSQIVSFTAGSAIGVDPVKGQLLWTYPFVTNYECNIASPLSIDGRLFLSAGENHGSVLLAWQEAGGDQPWKPVWESLGVTSVLRSEWQTPILLDGYLYGMDNVGGAGPVTHLTCIEAATGKRMWQQVRFGKGNLIAADGKLFLSTMKGELIVVRANPQRYEELGRAVLLGSTRQAPALSQGRLFLRDDENLLCVSVKDGE